MRKLFLFIIPLIVIGCSTPYQPKGFRGGYTDLNIQDNIFQISFSGNGYIGCQKVQNFALLRSAEVTIENGYRYFIVFGEKNINHQSSFMVPAQSHTTGMVYGHGDISTIQTQTTYTGGQTYNISKPTVTMMIRCYKTRPEGFVGIIYDAETVQANLRNKYKIIAKE